MPLTINEIILLGEVPITESITKDLVFKASASTSPTSFAQKTREQLANGLVGLDQLVYFYRQYSFNGSSSSIANVKSIIQNNYVKWFNGTLMGSASLEEESFESDFVPLDDPGPAEEQGMILAADRLKILSVSQIANTIVMIGENGLFYYEIMSNDSPCFYKAQGSTGCHNIYCKASVQLGFGVHYLSPMIEPNSKFWSPSVQMEWRTKHKNDKEMCAEVKSYYCFQCGNYTSTALATVLWKSVGSHCLNCYMSSIGECVACKTYTSGCVSVKCDNVFTLMCVKCTLTSEKCSVCGQYTTKALVKGKCRKCMPNVFIDYNTKPSPEFLGKPGPHFGIELEVEMKNGFAPYLETVASRFSEELEGFIYLKKDSSLALDGGFEIISHPASLRYWQDNDLKFWEAIKKLSVTCESWSADNCGLHVHIGRNEFKDYPHMARFYYFITSNKLFSAFIAERYQAKQSPFANVNSIEDCIGIVDGSIKLDKHTAINIHPVIPTIEVRIFKGNMKKQRILKNIEFVHAVWDFSRENPDLTVDQFISFVKERQSEYPNLHKYIAKYKKG